MVVGILQIYKELNYIDNLTLICIVVPICWITYWLNTARILYGRQGVMKRLKRQAVAYFRISQYSSQEKFTPRDTSDSKSCNLLCSLKVTLRTENTFHGLADPLEFSVPDMWLLFL
jgi:hypothetical protein